MERGKFEDSWKNAFDGAEAEPGGMVWTNVELGLEKAAGGKMKQRLLFYKMLAAASLFFAMALAGVYYLTLSDTEEQGLAQAANEATVDPANDKSNEPSELVYTEPVTSDQQVANSASPKLEHTNAPVLVARTNSIQGKGTVKADVPSVAVESVAGMEEATPALTEEPLATVSSELASANGTTGSKESVLAESKSPVIVPSEDEVQESNADPGMLLLAKMKDEEKKYREDEKKSSAAEKSWASLGFGAGSFNPNTPSSTYAQASFTSGSTGNTTSVSKPSPGSSYSVGVQMGGKISDRFVLQGGLSYLTQNASYTSNVVSLESNMNKATLDALAYTNAQSMSTSPYNVNSNLQYLSVPVQAGYLIVDRNFGWQLNGGVATDFFLQNTLTPDAENVDKVSQGAGTDSPYRTVNFSGLVGTEISYRFGDRYRLAVNPGIRYALNSIYKSEVSSQVSPVTYDVSLRFRYILR